jgi:hypothetical protein
LLWQSTTRVDIDVDPEVEGAARGEFGGRAAADT